MIEVTPLLFFSILGIYTGSVIGIVMWLNGRFSGLEKAISDRIPFYDYERKHEITEARIRNLEIQLAARQWNEVRKD